MNPNLAMIRDGKKFMWDGCPYATAEEASRAKAGYENDRFEVRLVEQDGTFLVYTRRAVKEAVATAQ